MAIDNIWVFAQEANGEPTSATLELLTKARSLGGTVTAFVAGDASAIAGTLGEYGAAKAYATGDLGGNLPGASVASAMKAVIDGGDAPDLVLFPQNYEGRDVVARLSVKLDRTVLTNNTDLTVDGDSVTVTTPVFGGNTLVTTTFTGGGPHLAVFRPKSFPAEAADGSAAEVVAAPVPELGATGGAVVAAVHVEESSGPRLDEADVVVSGGRGLGEAEKYAMIERLAKLLKGAAGASRAIVDAGWVPYSSQVGQTGKVVKPKVYIAAGISGATQHMVGMKGSKNI
ncbi:MAG: electron transfer flavoprotein subunit alpha/FixB family protein, partial [Ilumatobacteraceae bacterium]